MDWCSWTASICGSSSSWCNSSNIPTHLCCDCSGAHQHLLSLLLLHAFLCVQRPGSEALIRASSAEGEQAWVGAGQGWVLSEQGARQASFSQGDNFVLGQERWHHDGWWWRCGRRGQETLSPTVAPRGWRHTYTLMEHTTSYWYSTSVVTPHWTHRQTHARTCDMPIHPEAGI